MHHLVLALNFLNIQILSGKYLVHVVFWHSFILSQVKKTTKREIEHLKNFLSAGIIQQSRCLYNYARSGSPGSCSCKDNYLLKLVFNKLDTATWPFCNGQLRSFPCRLSLRTPWNNVQNNHIRRTNSAPLEYARVPLAFSCWYFAAAFCQIHWKYNLLVLQIWILCYSERF